MASKAKTEKAKSIGAAPDVDRAVNAWFVYLMTERQLAAHTVEAYRRDLAQFLGFLAGHFGAQPDLKLLFSLSARDVRAFLAARRGQDVGSRSLSRTLSALRMLSLIHI